MSRGFQHSRQLLPEFSSTPSSGLSCVVHKLRPPTNRSSGAVAKASGREAGGARFPGQWHSSLRRFAKQKGHLKSWDYFLHPAPFFKAITKHVAGVGCFTHLFLFSATEAFSRQSWRRWKSAWAPARGSLRTYYPQIPSRPLASCWCLKFQQVSVICYLLLKCTRV